MSNVQIISVKDTRENLAELLEQVAIGNKQFVITKFGKPKAMLKPLSDKGVQASTDMVGLTPEFKSWLDNFSVKYKDTIKELANLP